MNGTSLSINHAQHGVPFMFLTLTCNLNVGKYINFNVELFI